MSTFGLDDVLNLRVT